MLVARDLVAVQLVQLQQALVELVEDPVFKTEEAVLLVDLDGEGVVDALNLHVLMSGGYQADGAELVDDEVDRALASAELVDHVGQRLLQYVFRSYIGRIWNFSQSIVRFF